MVRGDKREWRGRLKGDRQNRTNGQCEKMRVTWVTERVPRDRTNGQSEKIRACVTGKLRGIPLS